MLHSRHSVLCVGRGRFTLVALATKAASSSRHLSLSCAGVCQSTCHPASPVSCCRGASHRRCSPCLWPRPARLRVGCRGFSGGPPFRSTWHRATAMWPPGAHVPPDEFAGLTACVPWPPHTYAALLSARSKVSVVPPQTWSMWPSAGQVWPIWGHGRCRPDLPQNKSASIATKKRRRRKRREGALGARLLPGGWQRICSQPGAEGGGCDRRGAAAHKLGKSQARTSTTEGAAKGVSAPYSSLEQTSSTCPMIAATCKVIPPHSRSGEAPPNSKWKQWRDWPKAVHPRDQSRFCFKLWAGPPQ